MKKRWYVVDSQEGLTSYSDKTQRGEDFSTRAAALKRARELANEEPHKAFLICETTDVVVVETKPVKIISI